MAVLIDANWIVCHNSQHVSDLMLGQAQKINTGTNCFFVFSQIK